MTDIVHCDCAGFQPPTSTASPRATASGGWKAPRHEVAGSWALAGSERYGDYMSGGTVKPDFCRRFLP